MNSEQKTPRTSNQGSYVARKRDISSQSSQGICRKRDYRHFSSTCKKRICVPLSQKSIERGKYIGHIVKLDGVLYHNGLIVQEAFNNRLPDRWIGINGSVKHTPRSRDLMSLAYYFGVPLRNYFMPKKFMT